MYFKCLLLLFIVNLNDAQFTYRRVDGSCRVPQLEHGRVRMRQRNKFVEFRCTPRYTLVGSKYATCRMGVWDVPKPVCVRPGCNALSEVKNGLSILSYNDSWALFFCLPNYKLTGSPVIYCDGHQWNDTAPTCTDSSTSKPNTSCDFESSETCGWMQDELHDFDWKRLNKQTPSSFLATGPNFDHTYGENGEGYYMYIESTGRIENETARLISPIYDSKLSQNGCFRFYYHMYGSAIGGLRVYQKRDSATIYELLHMDEEEKKKYLLFEKWRDQGNQWFESTSPLTPLDEDFQIVIEGIRGKSYASDIAIDDVAILQGENCTKQEATTAHSILVDSCAGRCHTSSERLLPWFCHCDVGCVDEGNCCGDFFDVCEFECPGPYCSNDTITTTDEQPQTEKLVATSSTTSPTTSTTEFFIFTTPDTTTKTTPKTESTAATFPKTTQPTSTPMTTTKTTTTEPPTTTSTTTLRTIVTSKTTTLEPATTTTKATTTKTTKPKPTKITKLSTTLKTTSMTPLTTRTSRTTKVATTRTSTVKVKTSRTTIISKKTTIDFEKTTTRPKAQKKVASGPSGVKIGIMVSVLCLVLCGVIWAMFAFVRGPRGTISLARLRGTVSRESEVRYLKADVDDE